jgi:ketosteroid isomerase-like protein
LSLEGRYTGSGTATGRQLDAQVAHVWDFRDGKVVRFQQYVNTAHLQQVLGLGEVQDAAVRS